MAEYDSFAKIYQETNFERPLFKFAVYPSFYSHFCDLKKKQVLDLACGEGLVARKLKRRGASKVMGIDLSKKMIALAKETENKEKLGIEYRVGQVGKLAKIGEFDYVSAAFLLHYSQSKEELKRMCKDCFRNLRKDGMLLAINNNPRYPLSKEEKYQNLISCANEPPVEGDKLLVHHPRTNIIFKNYFWKKETYEEALFDAGFRKIEWLPIKVSKDGIKEMGIGFWNDFLKQPFFIIIRCIK